ncbi:MAG: hypothetical protein N3A54_07495, partial [Patescibacteria group bacterium]|nr:hypothetical protein [Patescibacteria group bacterium]
LIKNQSSVINSTTDLEYKNIINNKLPEIEEYLLDYSDYVLKDYVYSKMGLFMSIFQLLYEKKPNLYKEMMNRIEEALSRAKEVTGTFDFPFDHIADKPSVFVNDYKRLVNKYLKK